MKDKKTMDELAKSIIEALQRKSNNLEKEIIALGGTPRSRKGIKVKECPFCGSNCVFLKEINGGPGIGVDGHCMKCMSCFAEGPIGGPKKEAVKKWNERHNEKP